jgi:hypothetical protein
VLQATLIDGVSVDSGHFMMTSFQVRSRCILVISCSDSCDFVRRCRGLGRPGSSVEDRSAGNILPTATGSSTSGANI